MKNNYVAFFDVDETLISIKSMFSFLDYYVGNLPSSVREAAKLKHNTLMNEIKFLSSNGTPREEINIIYYKYYAGTNPADLRKVGIEWHEINLREKTNFYNKKILKEIEYHKSQGAQIVLVSGSFFACLEPIAEYVEADAILATTLEIKDNLCTGEIVDGPVIAEGKALAVQNYLTNTGHNNFSASFAYGDHISDLPMLKVVGNKVVYANCHNLLNYARENAWRIITP